MALSLSKEIATFEAKLDALLQGDAGSFVVISGGNVVGIRHTETEAVEFGFRVLGSRPMLVRRIDRRPPRFQLPALTQALGAA